MVVVVPLDCFSFHHCLRNHTTQLPLSSRSTTSTLYFHSPIIQAKLPFFTNSDSFQVGRPIGTYGFINITRYLLLDKHSNDNKKCNQDFIFSMKLTFLIMHSLICKRSFKISLFKSNGFTQLLCLSLWAWHWLFTQGLGRIENSRCWRRQCQNQVGNLKKSTWFHAFLFPCIHTFYTWNCVMKIEPLILFE